MNKAFLISKTGNSKKLIVAAWTCCIAISSTAQNQSRDELLKTLMESNPKQFSHILNDQSGLQVQIIYSEINRDKKNKVQFRDHFYNVDDQRYFYPASTVKLPIAILALEKIRELAIPGLDRNSTMITGAAGERQTEVFNDPSSADGRPSIAHYIKKILLVSDNDAFNRLYEFLGQEYINNRLHAMGYTDIQILHRLDISLPEAENRWTNPLRFYDSTGKLLYEQPAVKSKMIYANRQTKMGKGFMRGGQLVNEPFDFSAKNRMTLNALHNILRSIIFPEAMNASQRFRLAPDDYLFLRKYMSMMPGESKRPAYDSTNAWDTYVKFLYYGAEKNKSEPGIRIFNKPGDAYGFMIDAAYIVNFNNKTDCIISAVIHCNSDGIYNDDRYEYKTIGLPFMKALGQLIMTYEQTRVRKKQPDLRSFLINYSDVEIR
ncbi:MAG: serine hydrolase [Chitinophagaceae bacterium]|nr:serine hydrolase [Chitinophagaceae bacterium]